MIKQSTVQSVALRQHEVEPHHNPCAQCGHTIAHPAWSEGDERCMSFVWACDDCGYEFTTKAVYLQPPSLWIAA